MEKSSVIEIRPLEASEAAKVVDFDHSYHTDHVWQMKIQSDGAQIGVTFREVRLPRSMHVEYPYVSEESEPNRRPLTSAFMAEVRNEAAGYVNLVLGRAPQAAWISDLAVLRRVRRQGIGTALVLQAQKWAREQDCSRVVLEMQSKNYPAIRLANKLGFEFSGFSDQYYANQDIALFFTRRL
jgi:ribosomal protein S18 acetylase RimI-like enzyme